MMTESIGTQLWRTTVEGDEGYEAARLRREEANERLTDAQRRLDDKAQELEELADRAHTARVRLELGEGDQEALQRIEASLETARAEHERLEEDVEAKTDALAILDERLSQATRIVREKRHTEYSEKYREAVQGLIDLYVQFDAQNRKVRKIEAEMSGRQFELPVNRPASWPEPQTGRGDRSGEWWLNELHTEGFTTNHEE